MTSQTLSLVALTCSLALPTVVYFMPTAADRQLAADVAELTALVKSGEAQKAKERDAAMAENERVSKAMRNYKQEYVDPKTLTDWMHRK